MASFSCCMIVKNEELVLERCLNSIIDLMDEIIIVDTGSTDKTKEIASKFTDKIYDFDWDDDFAAARNFSFEKATKDYIYVADADEYLDAANHEQLKLLKKFIDPQIEIVQMMYHTVSENTVLNIANEYRPKLYKRVRSFTWIDPIHETVRIEPLVFDSDITITHAPTENHAKRDFSIFKKAIVRDGGLSKKVAIMYATELIKVGSLDDLLDAKEYFKQLSESTSDEILQLASACVLTRIARISHDEVTMQMLLSEPALATACSEICYDSGLYYLDLADYKKAVSFLESAINDVPYLLDVHTSGDLALVALIQCYQKLLATAQTPAEKSAYVSKLSQYQQALKEWLPPTDSAVV